jgi:hypothetical protein
MLEEAEIPKGSIVTTRVSGEENPTPCILVIVPG